MLRVSMESPDHSMDFTKGSITSNMIKFALPLMAGNLLQQMYNLADAWAVGNSVVPLVFLSLSAVGNVVLDLIAVPVLHLGLRGAAGATVIAQYAAGIGILVYTLFRVPQFMPRRADCRWSSALLSDIWKLSMLTSLQQSIMNFGILFLLYGYYRAMNRPMMSVILTVASLGTRVVLAYALSAIPVIGVRGIWVSVPIGWALADLIGGGYMLRQRERLYR